MRRKLLSLLLTGALCAGAVVPAVSAEEQIEIVVTDDEDIEYTGDNEETVYEGDTEVPDDDMEGDGELVVVSEEDVEYVDDGTEASDDDNGSSDNETAAADSGTSDAADSASESTDSAAVDPEAEARAVRKAYIEEQLNLKNNASQEWTYSADADAWVLSITTAVVEPEIEDEEGVSVAVPGAYVIGIDTDGDGEADVTSETVSAAVKGSLVIDYNVAVTSTNGQVYTAATAPVIINTGAAGYSEQQNQTASTTYAAEGYINVACGNRGKQSTATDANGETYYTGDAPSCLVDQKNAVRFVKYNILLGNLPGSVDYFISTGGSGGGAHATMLAATSNNPDFYDYEIAVGAVGVYEDGNGGYVTSVTIDGEEVAISDGMWGCIAYSAITSLAEADMAMAFEYNLDTTYSFNTDFQKQVASYLSAEYMEYINAKNLTIDEEVVGFDLDGDGAISGNVPLTIEYDAEAYPETNGYYGTYLTLYLDTFEANLNHYLNSLDYAEGWTWFGEDGEALSDEEVAAMTLDDKKLAFIEGRYTKSSSGGMGGPGGMMGGGMGRGGMMDGNGPMGGGFGGPGGAMSGEIGGMDDAMSGDISGVDGAVSGAEGMDGMPGDMTADNGEMEVGTPEQGTTQASNSRTDSANYSSFEEMLAAYQADIEEVEAGDRYGKNIVELYNPLNYIGADGTDNPVWARILSGAAEGDISMMNSLNIGIAWLSAGTDAAIEWQWDGGHVPSEILGDSFALYVDEMYGEYVDGALTITKPEAEKQTENGTSESASGTDLSSWVDYDDLSNVSFTLAAAAAYRTAGASKATPGFDVMDYGQEDYVFGSTEKDARHWNRYLLNVFEEYADVLSALFNGGSAAEDAAADSSGAAESLDAADGALEEGPGEAAISGIEEHMEEAALVG